MLLMYYNTDTCLCVCWYATTFNWPLLLKSLILPHRPLNLTSYVINTYTVTYECNLSTTVYESENLIKMENSLLTIFDEIWPMTLYYSTGSLARFLNNLKNL